MTRLALLVVFALLALHPLSWPVLAGRDAHVRPAHAEIAAQSAESCPLVDEALRDETLGCAGAPGCWVPPCDHDSQDAARAIALAPAHQPPLWQHAPRAPPRH